MTIAKDTVVDIDFTLKDEKGAILDSSKDSEPLQYLHGYGQIIQGVEINLEGKTAGESLSFVVDPKSGYGEYDETQLISVPKDKIEGEGSLEIGSPISVRMKNGEKMFYVARIDDKDVVLDGNHPYAGMSLYFDITIRGVRNATPEEIEHGHTHSADEGCDSCEDCGSDCGHEH